MNLDEETVDEFFYDWLAGWMKEHKGKSHKFDEEVEKELREEADKAYPIVSFILKHFKALDEEYNQVIKQITDKGLHGPNSKIQIDFDWHSGFMSLAMEFAEKIAEGQPLYEEVQP